MNPKNISNVLISSKIDGFDLAVVEPADEYKLDASYQS
jgi:hypothetical protein